MVIPEKVPISVMWLLNWHQSSQSSSNRLTNPLRRQRGRLHLPKAAFVLCLSATKPPPASGNAGWLLESASHSKSVRRCLTNDPPALAAAGSVHKDPQSLSLTDAPAAADCGFLPTCDRLGFHVVHPRVRGQHGQV